MRKLHFAATVIALLSLTACGNDDFDDLPREIQTFISQYFPGQEIENFYEGSSGITVSLTNSATLYFNASSQWTGVDGNGNTLPEIFLYDHFPQALYDYLVTTSSLSQVYAVTRINGNYTVTLHNQIIRYTASTGQISDATL